MNSFKTFFHLRHEIELANVVKISIVDIYFWLLDQCVQLSKRGNMNRYRLCLLLELLSLVLRSRYLCLDTLCKVGTIKHQEIIPLLPILRMGLSNLKYLIFEALKIVLVLLNHLITPWSHH